MKWYDEFRVNDRIWVCRRFYAAMQTRYQEGTVQASGGSIRVLTWQDPPKYDIDKRCTVS